jgi:hypothetical protein
VPEAPVDEDGDAPGGERYVRPDPLAFGQVQPVILAEPVTLPVQRPAQRHLGLRASTPDRAHIGRPTFSQWMRVLGHGPQA